MFEAAELGRTLSKEEYAREVPLLRAALLEAEHGLVDQKRFAVVILINGVDGAGKGETVNLLHTWMDPRHLETHGLTEPTDEEREQPFMWRFWRMLPPRGKIGIFFGSWYTDPIVERVNRRGDSGELDRTLERIVRFERMLANEGLLLLKFWFHLSKQAQRRRLNSLAKDPRTAWRVTQDELRNFRRYDRFRRVSETVLRRTSTAEAPWIIVDGSDERHRSVTVGRAIQVAIKKRLESHNGVGKRHEPSPVVLAADPADKVALLRSLELGQRLERAAYDEALNDYQGRLSRLFRRRRMRKHAVVAVFEGSDAAGKGGAISRLVWALDARQYQIVPIAAPTDEEQRQPYLWRFWRNLPRRGRLAVFDRSWYGRVLVERVEQLAAEADWQRAYEEINDFEEQLCRSGIVLAKFWLQISPDEQLRRFEERQAASFKRYKITDEDWRNRAKWDLYEVAVTDMVERTSTEIAPWTLVEANDKYFARIKVIRTVVERLEAALG